MLYNEIAGDQIGFNNFISWVKQIRHSGCKKGISGDIGRYFDYDRYLSVGEVHIHALVEGKDWEFQQLRFRDSNLRSIENTAQHILARM